MERRSSPMVKSSLGLNKIHSEERALESVSRWGWCDIYFYRFYFLCKIWGKLGSMFWKVDSKFMLRQHNSIFMHRFPICSSLYFLHFFMLLVAHCLQDFPVCGQCSLRVLVRVYLRVNFFVSEKCLTPLYYICKTEMLRY